MSSKKIFQKNFNLEKTTFDPKTILIFKKIFISKLTQHPKTKIVELL